MPDRGWKYVLRVIAWITIATAVVPAAVSPASETNARPVAEAVHDAAPATLPGAGVDPTNGGAPASTLPPAGERAPSGDSDTAADREAAKPAAEAGNKPADPEEEFLPRSVDAKPLEVRWADAVRSVREKLRSGERRPADADALFDELSADFRTQLKTLRSSLREDRTATERVVDVHDRVRSLYLSRIDLMDIVTPTKRARLTGAGVEGLNELRSELRYLGAHLLFQSLRIPKEVWAAFENAQRAPLPSITVVLKLLLAVALFVTWRRWAAGGLVHVQARLRYARVRNRKFSRMERALRFFQRIRKPLEWLVLSSAVFGVLGLKAAADVERVVWTTLWWFLTAWLAVRVGQAILARNVEDVDAEVGRLRGRSLRLLAAWLLVIGLGLDIATDFAGNGTFYAWVWRSFELLTIPTVILLVSWWKPYIFTALRRESDASPLAATLAKNEKGTIGFVGAFVGVFYLLAIRIFTRVLREMENFEGGRRALSALADFEMIVSPLSDSEEQIADQPVSAETRDAIVKAEIEDIEDVGRSTIDAILARLDYPDSSTILIGERGSGKSTIVRRAAVESNGRIAVLDCPVGDFSELRSAIATMIGVEAKDLSTESFSEWIDERDVGMVVFENIHRQTRATMGGAAAMDAAVPFVRAVRGRAAWCSTVDAASAGYILALRGITIATPISVPPWNESQIRAFIERKCEKAGVTFDLARFHVPRYLDLERGNAEDSRRRLGFYRLLWHASEGNPETALEIFLRSLRTNGGGDLYIVEIRELSTLTLETQSTKTLLVLRFIIQCEYSTADEIAEGLGFSSQEVFNALELATANGWLGRGDGDRYRVSVRWFGTIARYLERRNLMSEAKIGVVS